MHHEFYKIYCGNELICKVQGKPETISTINTFLVEDKKLFPKSAKLPKYTYVLCN